MNGIPLNIDRLASFYKNRNVAKSRNSLKAIHDQLKQSIMKDANLYEKKSELGEKFELV